VAGYLELPGETAMVAKNRIIPRTASLADVVKLGGVDEIVVAAQDRRGRLPVDDLVECGFRGVTIMDYLTFWERETKRTNLEALHQDWVLFSSRFPGGRLHNFLSRSFDVTVSLVVMVIFFPLILATAVAVKLESPGPVFYRQERVGRGGMPFKLIKFRSMRVDAEEDGVPQWAAQNDPRMTTVGAFIRMVRIDEIPQVFNVLLGDMKFVGPRPERPYFVEQLAREIPFYRERFRVKPGITGWAQLNYPYGASIADAREKLQYDLYYLRHYTLMLDFIIVLQTIKVIIWPLKANQ
jgi:sugar transferase (PEP-CTERM system associated)